MHITTAKANPQSQAIRDSQPEESKAQGFKSLVVLPRANNFELSIKAQREKKIAIKIISDNTSKMVLLWPLGSMQLNQQNQIKVKFRKKNNQDQNCLDKIVCDLSWVKYYHYQKLYYQASNYWKSLINQLWSQQTPCQ